MDAEWTDQDVKAMSTIVVQDILNTDVDFLSVYEMAWEYLPEFAPDVDFLEEVLEEVISEIRKIRESWEAGDI